MRAFFICLSVLMGLWAHARPRRRLSNPSGENDHSVPGRRRHRSDRPYRRRRARQASAPTVRRREQAGRGGTARHRFRRQVGPGRIHAVMDRVGRPVGSAGGQIAARTRCQTILPSSAASRSSLTRSRFPPERDFKTFAELVAYAKSHPDGLNYGSAGPGSAPHLTIAMIAAEAGIQMVHVPFAGLAPSTNALVAGTVDVGLIIPVQAKAAHRRRQHSRAGDHRARSARACCPTCRRCARSASTERR